MAYPPKIDAALAILRATGISRWSYAPPFYRFVWSLGVPLRPPHFQTFFGNFLIMAPVFGAVSTLIAWPYGGGWPPFSFFVGHGVSTVAFGLIIAAYLRYRAHRHNLPAWSEIDVADRFD